MAQIVLMLFGSLVRAGLASWTGVLVREHWLTAAQGEQFSDDIAKHLLMWAPIVVAVLWSAFQKYWSQKKLVTALDAKAGTSEESIIDAIFAGLGSSLRKAAPLVLLVLLVGAGTARAQALPIDRLTPPLPTATERTAADIGSWATALAPVAFDAQTSWRAPQRLRAFELQGARVGITYGAVFLVKALVRRTRPCAPSCGTDNPDFSFYSAHTALAFSAVGGPSLSVALPLAIGTGGLRIAAGKHYLTDVLTGAVAGALVSRIR